jgi:hypothetical protein
MGAEEPGRSGDKALPLIRMRSRAAATTRDSAAAGAASTPSLGTPVTVPFLWEDAPGRPKHLPPPTDSANGTPVAASTDGGEGDNARPRLMPLKLPPRLQVPADHSLSPKTVLQAPYGCTGGSARRPPRMALRRVASLRWTPSAGGGFFSRRKTDSPDRDARAPGDASCTPSPSSSSSSSSVFFTDDSRRRPADPEEADGAKEGSVRITRFRRNRSLPSMTTSHLWVRRLCSPLLSSAFPARLALLLSFRKAEMKAEDSAWPSRSLFAELSMVSEVHVDFFLGFLCKFHNNIIIYMLHTIQFQTPPTN